jgi:hypothetical protein
MIRQHRPKLLQTHAHTPGLFVIQNRSNSNVLGTWLGGSWQEDTWLEKVIQETHDYIDEQRKARGHAPWNWKEITMTTSGTTLTPINELKSLKELYPYAVDLTKVRFDSATMEEIKIGDHDGEEAEIERVVARKKICLKCGGERHALDTRGFCRECKIKMGIFVAPSRAKTGPTEDREWEAKRTQLANPPNGEINVKTELLDFAWMQIKDDIRLEIYTKIWASLSPADRAKWIAVAINRQTVDGLRDRFASGGPSV